MQKADKYTREICNHNTYEYVGRGRANTPLYWCLHCGALAGEFCGRLKWSEPELNEITTPPPKIWEVDIKTGRALLGRAGWSEDGIRHWRAPGGDLFCGFVSALDHIGHELTPEALREYEWSIFEQAMIYHLWLEKANYPRKEWARFDGFIYTVTRDEQGHFTCSRRREKRG